MRSLASVSLSVLVLVFSSAAFAQAADDLETAQKAEGFAGILAETSDSATKLQIWHQEGLNGRVILAHLTENGEVLHSGTDQCAAFSAVMQAFETLPDITPGSLSMRGTADRIQQMPDRRTDANMWLIEVPGHTPDLAEVRLRIEGSQGPYPVWIERAVRTIKSCATASTGNL